MSEPTSEVLPKKQSVESPQALYCANHPQVEATLRCNRCEKPICLRCAVRTPTGYRCRECVRGQQKVFDTALWYDYPVAILIALVLSLIGSRIVPVLGFFTIFLTPVAGTIIAEVIRLAIRRRRSKNLFFAATAGVILGSLPVLLLLLLQGLGGGGSMRILFPLIWQLVYMLGAATTVFYRLSGIQMGR
jgi:hypothetical protein